MSYSAAVATIEQRPPRDKPAGAGGLGQPRGKGQATPLVSRIQRAGGGWNSRTSEIGPNRKLGTQPVGRAHVSWNARCDEFSTLNQPDKGGTHVTVAVYSRARVRAVLVLQLLKSLSLMVQCVVIHAKKAMQGRVLTAEKKTKPYRSARGIEQSRQG